MALYVNNNTGNFSDSTIWDTVDNTPTIHATTNVTLNSTGVFTPTYTAPNTTNKATGFAAYFVTLPGVGQTITATLYESGVATAAVGTASTTGLTIPGSGGVLIYFRFATPYTYTTTAAGAYKVQLKITASSCSLGADALGTSMSGVVTDDRHIAPGAGDDWIIIGSNNTTTTVITVTGTSNTAGSGTDTTTAASERTYTLCHVSAGGTLAWDQTANSKLTNKSSIMVNGTIQMGTTGSPVPAGITCTLSFDENGVGGNAGMWFSGIGKCSQQGNPLTYYKTKYASGSGIVASPLVVADPVDWTVGDEIWIGPTDNSATNYLNFFNGYIVTKNSTTSYVVEGAETVGNGDFETAGGGGADVFASWNETAGTGTITQDAITVHGGTKSAKLTAGSSTNTTIDQTMTVVPNTTYVISFWYQNSGTTAPRYSITDVTTGGSLQALTTLTASTGTWTQKTQIIQTGVTTTSIKLLLQCPAISTQIAYFDDVSLKNTFPATYTTDSWVLNVQRNVIVNTTNALFGMWYISASTTNDNVNIDWTRFDNVGSSVASREGILMANGSSTYGSCDYSVFTNSRRRAFWFGSSRTAQTFTGLIAGNTVANLSGAQTGLFDMGTSTGNKTFADCFAMKNNGSGWHIQGAGITLIRCVTVANCTSNSILDAGFQLGNSLVALTMSSCEAHCNRTYGYLWNGATSVTITSCLTGTKGINQLADVSAVTGLFDDGLFQTCTFGSATLMTNYLNMSAGSSIRFDTMGGTSYNDKVYTVYGTLYPTGAGLTDTTVRTAGTYNVGVAAEDETTGYIYSYYKPVSAQSALSALGFIYVNATMLADATASIVVNMYLPGSTSPDATKTMTMTTSAQSSSAVYALGAFYSGTVPGLARIDIVVKGVLGDVAYVADLDNGGNNLNSFKIWSNAQPSTLMPETLGDASAIWAVATSALTISGSIGNLLTKVLTVGKFLGLK